MDWNRFVPFACTTLAAIAVPCIGFMPTAQAAESTVGVCETPNNTVRIYQRDGQLMLRAFNRKQGSTWMNTAATRLTNPEIVEYRNIRGESTVAAQFNRNSKRDCTIQIGGKLEPGRVIAGNPTGDFGGSGGTNQGGTNAEAIKAERTCLDKARQSGYTVYQHSAAEKAASFHFVEMKGKTRSERHYSFTCRYNNAFGTANLERIQSIDPAPRPQPR